MVQGLDAVSPPEPTRDLPVGFRLEACPRCEYSLIGLPAQHRCPECGFEYDGRTFVLTGISRGATSIQTGRKLMWLFVAFGAWLGFSLIGLLVTAAPSWMPLALMMLWAGLFVYLVFTSRRERRGLERVLFAAGGFGYFANVSSGVVTEAKMVPWQEVDTVVIERKGANWHRIRIGSAAGIGGKLTQVRLDLGIRCDEPTARWIQSVLTARITSARAH